MEQERLDLAGISVAQPRCRRDRRSVSRRLWQDRSQHGAHGRSGISRQGAGLRSLRRCRDHGDPGRREIRGSSRNASRCDFVSIHCAVDAATRNPIGRAELLCLRPTAILVNVSVALIDEQALVELVVAGRIGGLALDVYSKEPLAIVGHPMTALIGRDNVILFPHLTFSPRKPCFALKPTRSLAVSRSCRTSGNRLLTRSPPESPERRGPLSELDHRQVVT